MFLFGLWPRFLGFVVFSAVCFAVSAGETQVWLGDLRVVVFGVVVFFVLLFYRFAYSKDFFVLVQCFVCLLTCKDRAISATSATLEEKKEILQEVKTGLAAQHKWIPSESPFSGICPVCPCG